MAKSEKFKITWEAEDGYCGGSRPQHTSISTGDLAGDEGDKELRDLFWEIIQSNFAEKVHPSCDQEEEFVAWAKEKIAAMKAEE